MRRPLFARLVTGATLALALALTSTGLLSAQDNPFLGEQPGTTTGTQALDWKAALASEDSFLAVLGERAAFVAPGVYKVKLGPGEAVRVAFGDQGRRFDRARFEAELVASRADLSQAAHPSRALLRKVHRLEDLVAALRTPPTKAAVTGWTCPSNDPSYEYTLDGGLSGGVATGKAKIGKAVDVGPLLPFYPNRYADTYASAFRGNNCLETTVSASDAITDGSLGFADATASVSCTGTCKAWETFSEVTQAGCTDGYRSLTRWGGLTLCL